MLMITLMFFAYTWSILMYCTHSTTNQSKVSSTKSNFAQLSFYNIVANNPQLKWPVSTLNTPNDSS